MYFGLGQHSSPIKELERLVRFALAVLDLTDQAIEARIRDIEPKRISSLCVQPLEVGMVVRLIQLARDFAYQGIHVQRIQRERDAGRRGFKKTT